jgi:hypothetical protein
MDGLINDKKKARQILHIDTDNISRSHGAELLTMQESEKLNS